MNTGKFAAAALLALMTASISACSRHEEDQRITLGFSQIGSESAWRLANTESIKSAAATSNIRLLFSDAEQKQENQVAALRDFIAQKVDVIAFAPVVATGDFGAALNPDALRNQMTGAIIQGIGGALWERVDFDADAQKTRRLSEYRVPRFTDVPAVDVHLIDRRDVAPAGAGESPITLTAPALASAIHAATGTRHRALPLVP